jgi:hypothetical protein
LALHEHSVVGFRFDNQEAGLAGNRVVEFELDNGLKVLLKPVQRAACQQLDLYRVAP